MHICFGYAAIIHERPSGYSFLAELGAVDCDQISIETAQSNLDCSVLEELPGKTIILGVLDLDDHAVETPETVADRIRRALPYKGAAELVAAPDCGMKYLPRESAFGKLQSLVAGARIVRDEAQAGWIGSTARTSVPSPGGLVTTSSPSTAPTRSASPVSPEPVPACAPPTPSSSTSTTSRSSPLATRTVAWLAFAYLATLVSASETVK